MDSPKTPAPSARFKSMFRSILRDQNTPSTGQNVRWGARDAVRTITPNTSANSTEGIPSTPLLEDEEHTSFLDRLRNDSSDEKAGKLDELAALGQSVGARFAASQSTTPPTAGPAPRLAASLAPIPRPRFNTFVPSTSSPLGQNDASLSFPQSMSPGTDFSSSNRPFDMSREMDSIPLADGSSGVVSDASVCGVRNGSRGGIPSVITLGEIEVDDTTFMTADSSGAGVRDPSPQNPVGGAGISVRGMTTMYPPGMYNFTKTQVPSFLTEPEGSLRKSRSFAQPKQRDTTGSSSLDFITGASTSGSNRPRTSLPLLPLPAFDPSPIPNVARSASTTLAQQSLLRDSAPLRSSLPARAGPTSASVSRSFSQSNLLSRAVSTRPPGAASMTFGRELPTLYPPGGFKFDQTRIDPENIPELTRFFTPALGGLDASREQDLFEDTDLAILPGSPKSPSLSANNSASQSISSVSSRSPSTPDSISLIDLSQLIESQYKADLAAHVALVPLLLARAEAAEASAGRLAGVVKDARGRVEELEYLCGELGQEVGVLRDEREGLAGERDGLRTQLGDVSSERDILLGEVGNLSTDLDTLARVQLDRGVLDAASSHAMREMQIALRKAEADAGRSKRRKEERNEARAAARELQAQVDMLMGEKTGIGREVRDMEVRLERERAGAGAREEFALEREAWEKERIVLLDRCVRAERAASGAPGSGSATGEDEKLRRQLEEYKAEVEAQWKYAEQADANIKTLEAELNTLRAEVEVTWRARKTLSPGGDTEWRRKEAEWTQQMNDWTRSQVAWTVERGRLEGRQRDMRAEIAALQDERDALRGEAEGAYIEAGRMTGELEKAEAELGRMDADMAALADRARHAEEMYVAAQNEVGQLDRKLHDLEKRVGDGDGSKEDLKRFEVEVRRLEAEREAMVEGVKGAEDRLREMERRAQELEERYALVVSEKMELAKDRAEVEDDVERLRAEVEDATHGRGEMEQERDALAEGLMAEHEAHAALVAEHEQLAHRLQESEREHQFALENQQRVERVVQIRNEEIAQAEERVRVLAREADELRADRRELERVKVQRDDAVQAEEHLRTQLEEAVRARAAEGVELTALRERVAKLGDESSRLQRRVHELKAESADKEVRIVQLNKARAQDADDKDGLNIALESKQQELELIKRKLGVRGTAGATPAPSRVNRASHIRRESSIASSSVAFETPLPRAVVRKDSNDRPPPSESTASVLSSSISTDPLRTSTRANIYGLSIDNTPNSVAITSTPETIKAPRRQLEMPPRPSLRTPSYSHSGLPSMSSSGLRGVHFAPSESDATTDAASDVTL
ncbi:hypothetical protein BDV93DRAFT_40146 [Ceratobasidium sp. AG-I]|nr:hypothetical protein BDV93DRAFT_40146 [Ceratobasidium sp. AG-I]